MNNILVLNGRNTVGQEKIRLTALTAPVGGAAV